MPQNGSSSRAGFIHGTPDCCGCFAIPGIRGLACGAAWRGGWDGLGERGFKKPPCPVELVPLVLHFFSLYVPLSQLSFHLEIVLHNNHGAPPLARKHKGRVKGTTGYTVRTSTQHSHTSQRAPARSTTPQRHWDSSIYPASVSQSLLKLQSPLLLFLISCSLPRRRLHRSIQRLVGSVSRPPPANHSLDRDSNP